MSEWVYYLQEGGGGPIKIGTTTNIQSRTRTLQTSTWRDIIELAREPGGHDLESARHRQFKHLRIRSDREWFREAPELMAHIEQLQAGRSPAVPRQWSMPSLPKLFRPRRRRRSYAARVLSGIARRSTAAAAVVAGLIGLGYVAAPAETATVLAFLASLL